MKKDKESKSHPKKESKTKKQKSMKKEDKYAEEDKAATKEFGTEEQEVATNESIEEQPVAFSYEDEREADKEGIKPKGDRHVEYSDNIPKLDYISVLGQVKVSLEQEEHDDFVLSAISHIEAALYKLKKRARPVPK